MFFHKPPQLGWNPEEIVQLCRDAGLDARSEGNCVLIVSHAQTGGPRFLRTTSLLPDYSSPTVIQLIFDGELFIRNIRSKCDVKFYTAGTLLKLSAVLSPQGFERISDETDFEIARRYKVPTDTISAIREEVYRRRQEKEARIKFQDFEAAAHERNLEYAALRRLDRLVSDAAKQKID